MTDPNFQSEPPENMPEPETPANAAPQGDSDKIAALEAALLDTKDKMMRALAEGENTRRRAVKEREDAAKFAVQSFAKDLLDFSDNFGRALAAIPPELKGTDPRLDNVLEGIDAMGRELQKVFDRHGIQKIEPMDQPFDPNFHEVMFEAPMPGKPDGIVIQVIDPGYTLAGRLLRAAKVGISRTPGASHQVDQKA